MLYIVSYKYSRPITCRITFSSHGKTAAAQSTVSYQTTPSITTTWNSTTVGLPGVLGVSGVTGVPGAPGAPGVSGLSGVPGVPGVPGGTGYPGWSGPAGSTGLPGSPGAAGPDGYQGSKGELTVTVDLRYAAKKSSKHLNLIHVGSPGLNGVSGMPGGIGATGLPGPSGLWLVVLTQRLEFVVHDMKLKSTDQLLKLLLHTACYHLL